MPAWPKSLSHGAGNQNQSPKQPEGCLFKMQRELGHRSWWKRGVGWVARKIALLEKKKHVKRERGTGKHNKSRAASSISSQKPVELVHRQIFEKPQRVAFCSVASACLTSLHSLSMVLSKWLHQDTMGLRSICKSHQLHPESPARWHSNPWDSLGPQEANVEMFRKDNGEHQVHGRRRISIRWRAECFSGSLSVVCYLLIAWSFQRIYIQAILKDYSGA